MNYRLAHVCLGSTDLDASLRFYCDVLGMKKKFDFLKDGKRFGFYIEVADGAFIEVFIADHVEVSHAHPLRHFCLETSDIDAVHKRLTDAGFAPSAKTMGCDKSWQIWVKSPEGLSFEFHEYTPESSQFTGADCIVDW